MLIKPPVQDMVAIDPQIMVISRREVRQVQVAQVQAQVDLVMEMDLIQRKHHPTRAVQVIAHRMAVVVVNQDIGLLHLHLSNLAIGHLHLHLPNLAIELLQLHLSNLVIDLLRPHLSNLVTNSSRFHWLNLVKNHAQINQNPY